MVASVEDLLQEARQLDLTDTEGRSRLGEIAEALRHEFPTNADLHDRLALDLESDRDAITETWFVASAFLANLWQGPAWSSGGGLEPGNFKNEQHLLSIAVPRFRSAGAQCGPHSSWAQLPTVLSGSAMDDPQSKAASRTVADWQVMQCDGDQPELWVKVTASSPCSRWARRSAA